ncbi:hypothetical protein JCM12296A_07440 [Desulfosarcina cetonica]
MAELWHVADQVARGQAVETLEHEVGELNHIFALLVLGVFVGLPAPPVQLTLELMPEMETELQLMLDKVTAAHDPLGELFSVLGID